MDALFALATDRPLTVVIDELPYLLKASPGLASLLQRELDPPAQGRHGSRIRLLLCGSAMSVMGKLLSGTAPLRGRASLEIVLSPLTYRDAARFWGVTDPRLAVLLHSVVGGTPAYRRQFVRDDAPTSLDDFDDWVTRTVLDPTTPLFREARYLLAEEADIRDPALYHSVLAAVATGNATWGGIASYIGRRTPDIAHPVAVLEDAGLLTREPDALRPGRPRYSITEPLITFYEAIMRASWSRLELGLGRRVWQESVQRFISQVVGPHFERLCRTFATTADPAVFGDVPGEVASGTVTDPATREQIEIDVVVLAPTEPGAPRRVLSLGEAKWGKQLGLRHLRRLERARELLGTRGFDTRDTRPACYGGGGFDNELLAASAGDPTDRFTGTVLHSSTYRTGAAFADRRAVVVGAGSSGADIVVDLLDHGAEVALAVRTPPHIVPRHRLGIPADLVGVALRRLPAAIGDRVVALASRTTVGDLRRYGLPAPSEGAVTRHRRDWTEPVVDSGTTDAIRRQRTPGRTGRGSRCGQSFLASSTTTPLKSRWSPESPI